MHLAARPGARKRPFSRRSWKLGGVAGEGPGARPERPLKRHSAAVGPSRWDWRGLMISVSLACQNQLPFPQTAARALRRFCHCRAASASASASASPARVPRRFPGRAVPWGAVPCSCVTECSCCAAAARTRPSLGAPAAAGHTPGQTADHTGRVPISGSRPPHPHTRPLGPWPETGPPAHRATR